MTLKADLITIVKKILEKNAKTFAQDINKSKKGGKLPFVSSLGGNRRTQDISFQLLRTPTQLLFDLKTHEQGLEKMREYHIPA
jgi:hypothetical protein